MRILHTESSCGWGGQELRVLAEVEGLTHRGHDLSMAAPLQSFLYKEARKRKLAVRALPIARKGFAGWRALRNLLKAEAFDIVNTHSSTDSWLVALARIGLRNPPAVVRTRHISAPIPNNLLSRWLYWGAAEQIVTTGEALRRQVVDQTGADPARVRSVPTGIDLTRFCPGDRVAARARLELARDDFLVGIVATLRSWKGHRYLLDALTLIPEERVKLVIVGAGPYEDTLRRQAAASGLAARVIMAGHQEDVVPWLHSFDVFALPSYANEGVPQAILQAMACALAVVTTDVGGIGEAARNAVTALVVEARNPPALAAAIVRLRDDPALRNRLGRAGNIEAQARFSREVMLDRMEAVFHAALRDAPVRRSTEVT
jgi:glycosyltransferase involved in cell wall biosynthesis